jgi:hypothetical protein
LPRRVRATGATLVGMRVLPLAAASAIALAGLAGAARADDRPRMLVLPLPATSAVDADTARAFDARLLVALDDTKRVVTVTAGEEPECTTTACLVELGIANDATLVLTISAVKEDGGLTLFGTVVDTRTKAAARRVELPRMTTAGLAKRAPAELAPQIVGTSKAAAGGPTTVGIVGPGGDAGMAATTTISDYLTAYQTFEVVPLDGTDRGNVTHRAEIAFTTMSIEENERWLCGWYDGHLVGTFSVTNLATGRSMFSKTVDISVSHRSAFWSREDVMTELVDDAVEGWLIAFRNAKIGHKLGQTARKRVK